MPEPIAHRLRKLVYGLYWHLERLITPGLRDSQYLYKEILESYVPHGGRWLELGCGHQILPAWIRSARQAENALIRRTRIAVGIDPCLEHIRSHQTIQHRVVATIENCPFQNKSFDFLSANMVMEHVQNPVAALSEAYRVMETGGILIFHTPNLWNYQVFLASLMPQYLKNTLVPLLEGRREEDVFPAAYQMNTVPQIERTAAECGFRVLEIKVVNSTAVSALLVPIAILELIFIRLLEIRFLRNYRTNIITVLQKQEMPQRHDPSRLSVQAAAH